MEFPPVNTATATPLPPLTDQLAREAAHQPALLLEEPEPAKDSAALLRLDIRDVLRAEIGLHEPMAEVMSEAICRGLRTRWGGREIYVPAEDIAERNRRIREAWRGNNAAEVLARFGISKATLYRVLNEQR